MDQADARPLLVEADGHGFFRERDSRHVVADHANPNGGEDAFRPASLRKTHGVTLCKKQSWKLSQPSNSLQEIG